MPLEIGAPAPAFTLPGAGGRETSLAGLAGRKVVLYFYPKDDTSGCTQEAKEFSELKPEFSAAGAQVIGVSPDSPKSHDKFAGKYGLDLTLLSDEAKETLQTYGVWVEKSMYGRKYWGAARVTFVIGKDGKIAHVFEKVKPAGHDRQVLEWI